jgi:hypothetical protein
VNEFVEMCHHLRVLNSVRMEKIGLPITVRQYYRLSTGVLTDRSVYLRMFMVNLFLACMQSASSRSLFVVCVS